jgi:hypothetical protein
MSRNFGGGAVMVWSAFGAKFKTSICWITTKMDSPDYTNLLDDDQMDIWTTRSSSCYSQISGLQRNKFQFWTGLHVLRT